MLAEIEQVQSKGFERDAEAEKNMNWHPYQRNRVLCFVGGPEGGRRFLFCFNLVSERRIRGNYFLINLSQCRSCRGGGGRDYVIKCPAAVAWLEANGWVP